MTQSQTMSQEEVVARVRKAIKIVDVLDRASGDPVCLETFQTMLEQSETSEAHIWSGLATVAGVNEPSERTKLVVLSILADRSRNFDPFAGFPGAIDPDLHPHDIHTNCNH